MLIGGAVRKASVLGYHVSPLFSYYSYYGPVFRVLLRVNPGKPPHGMYYLLQYILASHCADYLGEMLSLAGEWGWLGNGTKNNLKKLLNRMINETDPGLSFGYIQLDEIASRAKVNSPPIVTLMSAIEQEGYAVSRSHISNNAIKTFSNG
ncbi:hypothetical protein L1887_08895 [Cichorium endivia]|nr:hypothetical protein L1887_08895 [Cichorium endivia]